MQMQADLELGRAGRAGRTAPGRGVRLWSMADEAGMAPSLKPEILRLELSSVRLQAASLPEAVERLLVADIAPVVYPPHNQPIVDAMLRVPLHDGLTRAAADAALLASVPEASVRAFLLQNLRLGTPPAWRIGLDEIEAAMADIEGWDRPADATSAGATYEGATYAGRTLFVAGETSGYISREDRPAIRVLFPAARFVTVKRAGHWLHADNPAGFLAVVEAFLSTPQVQ